MRGQVSKIHSDFYYAVPLNIADNGVENEAENAVKSKVYECKAREVLKKQKQKICTGDIVEVENGYITRIYPRKSYIPRPPVANINQAVIVSAVKEPELDFHQLDRYISFAEYYNLEIKLCFNKNDLSSDDKLIERVFSIYEPLGYDIVFTSALEGFEIDVFEEILSGKLSVLCGQSGVGKSSLINSLNSEFELRTKPVSEKHGRGTHTTRHCEIVEVSDGIRVIDTPGFSNLKFDFLLPKNVSGLFREFRGVKCKFADCLHIHEDGCGVLENIKNISLERYESYLEFVKEAELYKKKIKSQSEKIESGYKQNFNKITVKVSAKKRQSSRRTAKQDLYKNSRELENE